MQNSKCKMQNFGAKPIIYKASRVKKPNRILAYLRIELYTKKVHNYGVYLYTKRGKNMAVFKCKMCGGALEINSGDSVAVCEYCNTKQTLPKLDDEKRTQLYDRANYFRRENEFDKAMGIYEMILSDDKEDCESYWGIVLCRYGIEYVEDPRSHKRIPTVNRAQFTSIFDDEDYKNAINYADALQKEVYEAEAEIIDKIQKGILAISQKEEPFDVFICYKETDAFGNRTQDSVYAQDIYTALTKEGYKVFFARITLEDKLGSAYEPYIFAALNSARVMLVVGTSKDNFNAVWVKNEWSRYLNLIKQGKEKTLIPVYKDISPYDMPEEFQYLQSQDMGKIGYLQDLIHGINKLVEVNKTTVKETVVINQGNSQAEPLLKRAFMFLEDGDFSRADEFCEQVLNINPENAQAYLGKLMVELRIKKQDDLKNQPQPFNNSNNYQKAIRFADEKLKAEIIGYNDFIANRNEQQRLESIYTSALNILNTSDSHTLILEAAERFEAIKNYKDSAELNKKCLEKAEVLKKEEIYKKADEVFNNSHRWAGKDNDINAFEESARLFRSIPGWRDADEKVQKCHEIINELNVKIAEEKRERERLAEIEGQKLKKRNKILKIGSAVAGGVVSLIVVFTIILNSIIIPTSKYNKAVELMNNGCYNSAIKYFEDSGSYKDSEEKIKECQKLILTVKLPPDQATDYLWFGKYEQNNDTSNGKEDIEWLVLDKQDDKILVISKYALDCKPYNDECVGVTWETCTLRNWLNNDFIDNAFTDEEKAMIATTTVTAHHNPHYDTSPGNDTQDKIFLLSLGEVDTYFSSADEKTCQPTSSTIWSGAWADSSNNCIWWLRSPGDNQEHGTFVCYDGEVAVGGTSCSVDCNNYAVRPAMWIEIK